MTWGDWLMAGACLLFVLAGSAKFWEQGFAPKMVGVALICLGIANTLLLYVSRGTR